MRIVAALLALLLFPACDRDSPTEPSNGALFQIRVCRGSEHAPGGELFRLRVKDRATIAEVQGLVGRGPVRIVGGPLVAGHGGFNQPWSWHIDPDRVDVGEGAIELCDGCPSFIEADLQYWLGNVGTYCPWSAEVISRLE